MRHFVSIPVPDEAREHLDSYLEVRRIGEPDLRWTCPSRWHLTLAFLPDVDEVDLDDLAERLDVACGRRDPLDLRIRGGGAFTSPFRARVLWAGADATEADREELDLLAVGVRHAAAAAGTVVEGGAFVPHITLARSPRPRDLRHLVDVVDLYEGPSWRVTSVDLVASHVGAGPVRHEVVSTHDLSKTDQDDDERWWRRGFLDRSEP